MHGPRAPSNVRHDACESLRFELHLRGRRRDCLFEQRVGLRERRLIAHRREHVTGLPEWLIGAIAAKREEASALSEKGMCPFGQVPEFRPAGCGFGVESRRAGKVAGVLGKLGAGA